MKLKRLLKISREQGIWRARNLEYCGFGITNSEKTRREFWKRFWGCSKSAPSSLRPKVGDLLPQGEKEKPAAYLSQNKHLVSANIKTAQPSVEPF